MLPQPFPSSFTHDDAVLSLLVQQLYHVPTHVQHLLKVNINELFGMCVQRRVGDLFNYSLPFLFIGNGLRCENGVVFEDGHDHIGVIDWVIVGVY